MAQRQGPSWLRIGGLAAACFSCTLLLGANVVSGGQEDDDDDDDDEAQRYKGSETLELVSVAPNLARCGDVPNFEAVFEGSGIDTAGGVFTVVSSGCQNIATGLVFDLVATDTYANGDSVNIEADPFFLVFDPQICVSSNVDPVRYKIKGGTGAFAGAKGGGKFDFASNDPNCNGQLSPSFVWFKGKIR
jgi:hypothetical protein